MAATRLNPDAQEAIARGRFLRLSPTKARQVVDLIRGTHVDDARRVLRYTPRAASVPVAKILESAIANAEHNHGYPADELIVTRAWVDEGPTLKRYRPRALGRATRIRKRTCHISLVVGRHETPEPVARTRRDERASGQTTGKKTTASKSTATKTTARKTAANKTTAKINTASKTTASKTTRRTTKKNDGDNE